MSLINYDNGFTKLSNDLQKAIFSQSFTGSELKVLLAVIRLTFGYNCEEKELTHALISACSGVGERTERRALKKLAENKIIFVKEGSHNNRHIIGINKNLEEWHTAFNFCPEHGQNDHTSMDKNDHTSMDKTDLPYKDSITKDNIKDSVCNNTAHTDEKSNVKKMWDELKAYSNSAKQYLTKSEKRIFDKWVNEYNFSFDMIKAAYDKSSNYTENLSIQYMDRIITEWHEKGISSKEKLDESKTAVQNNNYFSRQPKMNLTETHTAPPSYDIELAMKKAMMSVPKLKKIRN